MGEKKVKAMGWWPRGVAPKPLSQGMSVASVSHTPGKYVESVTTTYGGLIEKHIVEGEGLFLRVETLATGTLAGIDLRWVETARFRRMPCKTLEEAFDALNKGYAMGLPQDDFGNPAYYVGWGYYVGTVHGDHVLPMLKFRLGGKKHGFLAYVPAVKSDRFADPKSQVVSVAEWGKLQDKKKGELKKDK